MHLIECFKNSFRLKPCNFSWYGNMTWRAVSSYYNSTPTTSKLWLYIQELKQFVEFHYRELKKNLQASYTHTMS